MGELYATIPWNELVSTLCSLEKEKQKSGAPSWFDTQGKLGLMFLKHYFQVSDAQLLERLQSDWAAQLFCGIYLGEDQRIQDASIVSRVRSSLSASGHWQALQSRLMSYWKAELEHPHTLLMDATCYESYIRFPSDVKILWESCRWIVEKGIYVLCQAMKIARPRSKYRLQKRKYLHYSRLRKKSYAKTRSRIRSLLHLLAQSIEQLKDLLHSYPEATLWLSPHFLNRLPVIKEVLQQQKYLYETPAQDRQAMPDRIVSLHKPYLGPIVRGKENKPVEFGHKAHILQIGGLNFIEHLSPQAFNESTRLESSILYHERHFGSCKQVSADRIYANRENRKKLEARDIFSNFAPLGRRPQEVDQASKELRQALNKARSTRLEGSFGNEKNHYGLRKNKAQTQANEQVWIFFGIQTANAVKIREQRKLKEKEQKEAEEKIKYKH